MAEEKRRKPGFFARVFTVTNVEEPPDPTPEDMHGEPIPDNGEPESPAQEARKGVFGRFFGKKETPVEEVEESIEEAAESEAEPRRNWFRRLSDRLGKTRKGLVDNVRGVLGMAGKLDEDTIEELEGLLIQSDISFETTEKIIRRMRAEVKSYSKNEKYDLVEIFKEAVHDILVNSAPGFEPQIPEAGPYVVLVVGVNGVGKTTTIAKMAKRCTDAGLKTMLVAGDTFRAAAVEQLEIWADRTGSDFVRAPHGSDAAALCYDAVQRAKARGIQVLFVDTAGRLHTKSSLMDELGKIHRVIEKQLPGAPHETLLVLDATTGQNALQQVKVFSQAVKVTGLILTKLDGTAKGGILLSILDQYKIPITLIGVGESADDLRDFDPDQFSRALFGEEDYKGSKETVATN